ncbi:MAG: hypothetical protein R3C05_28725 [Pirellulaceae bacterium]
MTHDQDSDASNGVAMSIYFTGLEPVVDLVAAASLVVNGTNDDNAINYSAGTVATNGLVSVDGFETIEFSNKSTLTINARSGSDRISLNNAATPTGLTGDADGNAANGVNPILINGGDPTAGTDTVVISGRAGAADTVTFAPTSNQAATIAGAGPVAVALAGVEEAMLDGQGGTT